MNGAPMAVHDPELIGGASAMRRDAMVFLYMFLAYLP